MKIIVVHGEHNIKSYERLSSFIDVARKRNWELVRLEDDKKLQEQVGANSLFPNKRLFIARDINKRNKDEISWLINESPKFEGNLILYQEGLIKKTILDKLPKPRKIEEYKVPVKIFDFLNSLIPGNRANSLRLLQKLLISEPVELVFYLLGRHFRDLYWVEISPSDIPYPSWRVARLEKQAEKFGHEKLKSLIHKLSEIDIKVKSSKSNLQAELDLLIVKELE